MGIEHLLDKNEFESLQHARHQIDTLLLESGLEVYADDFDYFSEIYVSHDHRYLCSFGYEYIGGNARLFTITGHHEKYHGDINDAVKWIMDYLKSVDLIGNR